MKPDRNKTRDPDQEAARGAHNARCILADGPSQAILWEFIRWSHDEEALGEDDPASVAYDRAFREVLIPHLVDERAAREQAEQDLAGAVERWREEGRQAD